MDMLELYEASLANTGRIVAGVRADQMSLSTPCARFDVRALLNHIVGGQQLLAEAGRGGRAPAPAGGAFPDVVDGDPAGAYARSSKLVLEVFREPGVLERTFALGVDVPGPEALGIGLMDAVVHGWDLATATGQEHGIEPAVAEMLLGACRGFVNERFRSSEGDPFPPESPAPEGAAAVERLVAFLGRRP